MSKFTLLSSAGENFSTKIQSNIPNPKNTNQEKAGQGRHQEGGSRGPAPQLEC